MVCTFVVSMKHVYAGDVNYVYEFDLGNKHDKLSWRVEYSYKLKNVVTIDFSTLFLYTLLMRPFLYMTSSLEFSKKGVHR